MISKSVAKKVFWFVMDVLLILFVIPFGFVMTYYFHLFFTGENRAGLFGDLVTFSTTMSWVSCAFLFLIALILRTMIKHRIRWYAMFVVSFVGGGLWILLLNSFVETTFTFWRSLFPLTLCCIISTGYALGKVLYSDDSWNFAAEPQLDFHEDVREELEDDQESEQGSEVGDQSSEDEQDPDVPPLS